MLYCTVMCCLYFVVLWCVAVFCVTSATQCCVMWALGGGPWALGCALWAVGCDLWLVVCGLWSVACGLWSLVGRLWSVVLGLWFLVNGWWSVVSGQWSVVRGWWSMVGGTQVFWLFRRRSDNLFRRHFGNVLAFFCVSDWNVARTTHESAAGTSSRGGCQKAFLAPVALIVSGKVVYLRLLVVRGWWSLVCGLWSVVCGRWSVVGGLLSVVSGQWSVVSGQWSVVYGWWSIVCGRWSVVRKGCARKARAHHTNLCFLTTLRHN